MNRKLLRRMALPLIAACVVLADCSNNTTTTAGPPTAFAVMRFTSAGALDPAFAGGRGVATTTITPGLFDFALAAAVQPADNMILVGGSSGLAGSAQIALVRYKDVDGSLDSGFGSGGIVKTPAPAGTNSAGASAIVVQPDHKILVAALTFTASTGNTGIALIRYQPDGTLDNTFNTPGIVIATIGSGKVDDTCALVLQGTNIIVAGASTNGSVVLYRYDTNGNLDTTFGSPTTPGSTVTSLPGALSPAIALQSSGKIILVSGTNNDQAVLRYSASGILDPSFGTAGIVTTDINNGVNFANAVAIMQDGSDKIVVAGHANVSGNTSDISLVRYTIDGALDATFVGPNGNLNPGIVTVDFSGNFDNAFSVALESPAAPTTRILVSGNTGLGGFSQAVVLRYNADGTLDTTFGPPNGFVVPPLFGPSNIASGNAVVLQSTLGIVVAGYD